MGGDLVVVAAATDVESVDEVGAGPFGSGREAMFGFEVWGSLIAHRGGVGKSKSCPDCASSEFSVVIDRDLKRNCLCTRCNSCWHPVVDQLQRVDTALCPGCGLAPVVCSGHSKSPADPAI